MSAQSTPRGFRVQIGLFGRRNTGKSSLLNAITRQEVSIVSAVAGTTTDPVEKPMELLPLGPVVFIDTAGLDDVGALGEERIAKTRRTLDRADLAVIVSDGEWNGYEEALLEELDRRHVPAVVAFNKSDLGEASGCVRAALARRQVKVVGVSALTGEGVAQLRAAIVESAPKDAAGEPAIVSDLVGPGELAVLVVPIDKEAPKGRLILPQAQTIRDLIDHDAQCLVVKERELAAALANLRQPPRLVVTDSQAFLKVAADVPNGVRLTSFSILFARLKGDLAEQAVGAAAIGDLRDGDRVLIAEACTHHPIGEDIGRVKIPRWIAQYTGARIEFMHCRGHDFPEDLTQYRLIVHCGGCMLNRRAMTARIARAQTAGVAITNYGLAIAFSLGMLERALEPFPAALEAFRNRRVKRKSATRDAVEVIIVGD
jgi:[FeFe] hydrogenase H-cluster maturation GTPase HydF